jgi:hypothetical protein
LLFYDTDQICLPYCTLRLSLTCDFAEDAVPSSDLCNKKNPIIDILNITVSAIDDGWLM